ncbi:MAG: PQQ-binding-like beta-propeller repeat protein [Pirellulaceae bacterium]|nr:PQQ-binding-like beta-propeller repeat protein [Pirellulaceae bacterium]MDP7019183.1 PQQ-binding-like beta-propeller repeat protein [Pirellulaceae bacterium]
MTGCHDVAARYLVVVGMFFLSLPPFAGQVRGADNWPQFRGAGAAGIGSGKPPIEWDVESGRNIAWKTRVPGLGHSSPIVWGDRVFLTTAVHEKLDAPALSTGWLGGSGDPIEEEGDWTWQVRCLRLTDGDLLWQRDVKSGAPTIKRHAKASHANCSVATDGKRVVAFFGSEGLYCFDVDGQLEWKKDLGRLHSGPYDAPKLEWGFASSPVIHDSKVILQCDCLNARFVVVLDLMTGRELRRIVRDDVATWSTPLVVTHQGRTQVVCNGYRQMAGYDLESGEQLWTLRDGGDVPVPSPLFANGLIYLTNSHGRAPTFAIEPTARGDLTPSDDDEAERPAGLAWWQPRDGSYIPTPLVYDDRLYTCNDNGRLVVRNALSGELIYRKRISASGATYSASAVAANGFLYFTAETGVVTVVKTGDQYELAAKNEMGEITMSTPSIAGDRLLIRTARDLYCIAEKPAGAKP